MSTTITDSLGAGADAGVMNDTIDPDPEVLERARSPRRYSAKYKARVLAEYETLDKQGKGALLRREGLYTSLIAAWRTQHDRGALEALAKPAGRRQADPREREVARLRVRVDRLESELDRARKVIEVQGKLALLTVMWVMPRSERARVRVGVGG